MSEFDLVVRGGRVATASDAFDADIGVKDGTIVALGTGLGYIGLDLRMVEAKRSA